MSLRLGTGLGLTSFGGVSTPAAPPAGTITIDTLTYTRGTAGVAPDLSSTVSSTGTTTANYTMRGVLAATAQTEAQIDASGDKFEITAATLAALDGSLDLSNSATAGVISAYIFDSSAPVVKSAVLTETAVTYDAAAPTFSSAEVGTVDATSLIVTFDKALYGSTSAADWDVQVAGSPATESAAVISGSTVDITLSAAVTNGQAVTVAYTGTGLVGVDAEQVATFTAQSVTNNVAAASTDLLQVISGLGTFAVDDGKWNPEAGLTINTTSEKLEVNTGANFLGIRRLSTGRFPIGPAEAADVGDILDLEIDVSSLTTHTRSRVKIEAYTSGGTSIEAPFVFDTSSDGDLVVGVNSKLSAYTIPATTAFLDIEFEVVLSGFVGEINRLSLLVQ